jgi:hypothetical protein
MEAVKDPKINEALEILNNTAKEKKDELKQLINDKYSNVRDVVGTVRVTRRLMGSMPWLILGGVASGFLVLGYFIGQSRKR